MHVKQASHFNPYRNTKKEQPMKRSTIIIIGLVIALVTSVLVYNAFAPQSSEMINASGGQLDIDITNAEIGYTSKYIEISPSSIVVKNDYKTVEIGVHNLYSNSETNVSIEITNTGVLPIKFIWIRQDVEDVVDMNSDSVVEVGLLDDINVQYDLYSKTRKTDYVLKASESRAITDPAMRALDGSEIVFQPGESLRLDVKITVKGDSDTSFEHKSFVFSVTPFFTQGF